jgi:hypothetical protein
MSHLWSVGITVSNFPKHREVIIVFTGGKITNMTNNLHVSNTTVSSPRIIGLNIVFEIKQEPSNFGVDEMHLIFWKVIDKSPCILGIKPNLSSRILVNNWWREVMNSWSVSSVESYSAIISTGTT